MLVNQSQRRIRPTRRRGSCNVLHVSYLRMGFFLGKHKVELLPWGRTQFKTQRVSRNVGQSFCIFRIGFVQMS